jgi:DNA-binding CsgD family transcriptional regulator
MNLIKESSKWCPGLEQMQPCAHQSNIIDFIPLSINQSTSKLPQIINKMAKMYTVQGLTTRQIALKLGVSKTLVLDRLKAAGLEKELKAKRLNTKLANPPYGMHYCDGRLVTLRREQKIIRLLVELRDRESKTYIDIADQLNRKGYKTRAKTTWTLNTVKQLYYRWRGKV